MRCSKSITFRFIDAFFLAFVFLFQSVILNYFLINHFSKSSFPFLWFLGDFFCLLNFSLTLFLAHRSHEKAKKQSRGSLSIYSSSSGGQNGVGVAGGVSPHRPSSRLSLGSQASEHNWPNNLRCYNEMPKFPWAYISWIVYSVILIAKCATLFKSEIPQHLKKDDFFGPQIIKFCIGLSAIIFSLLVEAHKDSHDEPLRNAYVNTISFGIALEILDSASFLSLLIGSESGLLYTYKFENFIIALSSMNLMLPAISLYKLCVSDFGRTYPVPLETLYKVLHLILVNGSYLGVRVYLWSMFSTDTSIFIIKNIYSIIIFFREIGSDLSKLKVIWQYKIQNQNEKKLTKPTATSTPIKMNHLFGPKKTDTDKPAPNGDQPQSKPTPPPPTIHEVDEFGEGSGGNHSPSLSARIPV